MLSQSIVDKVVVHADNVPEEEECNSVFTVDQRFCPCGAAPAEEMIVSIGKGAVYTQTIAATVLPPESAALLVGQLVGGHHVDGFFLQNHIANT